MPTDSRQAALQRHAAAILAAVLLMALAWTGWRVVQQVRLAPSTVPAATIAASRTVHGDAATRQRATALASGPRWGELTPGQSDVLEPLEERWSLMDALQKRRWIALAEGYDKLSEKEQEKLRSRMQDWSSLSAQQRSQARLNFALSNRFATDKRAQWEAYQALSDEEKRLLAARAAPKPAGAATAIQPVAPKRLARIPAAAVAPSTVPNLPKIPPATIHHPPPPVPATPAMVETSPVRPPALVETSPVNTPSATASQLPPLDHHEGPEQAGESSPHTAP
ncbi:DUF3106 domain-containing protein [Delftia sp. PS-11]|uniref:DUF3106 domain-containing protein n=1 Tax=Delftia sp. PS-11 TaxID=2767222 RepID=UPI002456079C|nr:DUF3106 domain-containing protein [Delftia sp. PS-11]KAJ8744757.1 DUF3106 domain-containing protein [Delftia sp. PS-11]